ncbi:MAG: SDR family NAD(P)-dependent oxidoreductase [Actinomycetota bacterium]|nr:SDR family NAD(P)-dependent oxidoreductase [Actinomycetota bacterium]
MDSLADKVALVTGGASGLGRATCRALAAEGAEIVVADVDEPGGEEAAREVGGHFVRTDVSVLEENLAAVAFAGERCGGLDLAFLNAGVASGCGVGEDFHLALYRRAMGINLDGVVFGAHAVLPALRARGGGAVVATASLAGLTGVPMDPIYAANKHAVVGLTRSLGPGLAAEGIRFNAVCPGFAESALVAPMREALIDAGFRILPAETVADTVVGLMRSEANGECWFVQPDREPGPFRFRGVPGPGNPRTGVADAPLG